MTPQIRQIDTVLGPLPLLLSPFLQNQKIYSGLSSCLLRIGDSIALDSLPISRGSGDYHSPPTKMLRQGVSSLPPPHPPPQTRRSARVAPKSSEDQKVQRCAEIRPRSHAYISEPKKCCWRNTPFASNFVQFLSQNIGGCGSSQTEIFKLRSVASIFFQFWEFWTTEGNLRDLVFSAEKYQAFTTWPCKSLLVGECCFFLDHLKDPPKKQKYQLGWFLQKKLTANQ